MQQWRCKSMESNKNELVWYTITFVYTYTCTNMLYLGIWAMVVRRFPIYWRSERGNGAKRGQTTREKRTHNLISNPESKKQSQDTHGIISAVVMARHVGERKNEHTTSFDKRKIEDEKKNEKAQAYTLHIHQTEHSMWNIGSILRFDGVVFSHWLHTIPMIRFTRVSHCSLFAFLLYVLHIKRSAFFGFLFFSFCSTSLLPLAFIFSYAFVCDFMENIRYSAFEAHWREHQVSIGWIVKPWLKSKIILCDKIPKANYSHLYSQLVDGNV